MKPILRVVRMPGLPYHPIQDATEEEILEMVREHGAQQVEVLEDDLGDTNVMVETGVFLRMCETGEAYDDYWMREYARRNGQPT